MFRLAIPPEDLVLAALGYQTHITLPRPQLVAQLYKIIIYFSIQITQK